MRKAIKNHEGSSRTYVLVTAAYNEDRYIGRLLQAVVAQTVRPQKWIVVSDGSTDHTDQIVQRYADEYNFIEPYKIMEDHPRNFTAQVYAINTGFARLKGTDCDFIGNLDADISLEPTYFESLLERFSQDPNLGLAGGFIYEEDGGEFRCRRSNSVTSVAHAVQLFRHECLEVLGGYKAFSWAGADTYAEVSLRMRGWRVQSFPELKVFHHRPTGNAFGLLHSWYRGGIMDFYIGTHPVFQIARMLRRCQEKPYVLGAVVRLAAFVWAYCSGEQRQVSEEFVRFMRQEQMERLKRFWNWRSPIPKCAVIAGRNWPRHSKGNK